MGAIINVPFWTMFGVWVAGLTLLFAVRGGWATRMRLRWGVGVGGGLLVTEMFFFESWVRIDFPRYLIEIPEVFQYWIPRPIIELLFKLAGIDWASKLLYLLEDLSLNGVMLQLVPTLSLAARIFCVLPLGLAVFTILGAPIAAIRPGHVVIKSCGGILTGLSIIAILGLFVVLPELDALGGLGEFQWMLITTLLNTNIGDAPWLTLVGLFMLVGEGIIELKDREQGEDQSPSFDEEYL